MERKVSCRCEMMNKCMGVVILAVQSKIITKLFGYVSGMLMSDATQCLAHQGNQTKILLQRKLMTDEK